MHMGHHFGHLRAVLGNSGLNHLNHQRFLQSGVANWMASQSRVVPCCDLDIVGGDGTAIGIPISNLKGMTPVWQPAECVGLQVPDDQEFENGRMGRIPISFNGVGKAEAQVARRKLRDLLTTGISQKLSEQYWDDYHERIRHWLPAEFNEALMLLARLDDDSLKRHLRSLLRDCIAECSVTSLIPKRLLDPIQVLCESIAQSNANRRSCLLQIRSQFPQFDAGSVLRPVYHTLSACVDSFESTQIVVKLIEIICESHSYQVPIFVEFSSRYHISFFV